jgi:hypothetical protein
MSNKILNFAVLSFFCLFVAGCTPIAPKKADEGPPPPQNMNNSTDELQMVTEMSLDQARKYGAERVLVVLEIDNTLLASDQDSDCPSDEMKLIQDDSLKQVKRIQDAGMRVIVMTTRGPECQQRTTAQLRSYGFEFQSSAWPPRDGFPDPFQAGDATRPVLYQDGVFYTAGQNKGKMLQVLLEKSSEPNPVIFLVVDQRKDKLMEVMKVFSWTGTKVQSWQYTRADTADTATVN